MKRKRPLAESCWLKGGAMRATWQMTRTLGIAIIALTHSIQSQAQVPVAVPRPETVAKGGQRVMAAAVTSQERNLPSGLFLTDPESGWIRFRHSLQDEPDLIGFDQFEEYLYSFKEPWAVVFADPLLYVYDGADRIIWSVEFTGGYKQKPKPELITGFRQHPSHIAVSPHGLVAAMEGNYVVFLQRERPPAYYKQRRFLEPIDLAFSSWDTLQVLDGSCNCLTSITFSRLKEGQVVFEKESEAIVPPDAGQTWQAMSIYEGLVYLADQTTVYAYLASDQRLVPVARIPAQQSPIRQLALTRESLYLLQQDHIRRYPRKQPVDFVLEGGPLDSQRVLLALYVYLNGSNLLPTRRIVAQRPYERLEEFLFDNKVLLVPREASAVQFERSIGARRSVGRASPEVSEFMTLLCKLNAGFCPAPTTPDAQPASLTMPIARGTELKAPAIQVISRLGTDDIDLNGQGLEAHADYRVPSRELREKVNTSLLLRLNPSWADQELWSRTRGPAVVPAEKWTAIAAVPVPEFENKGTSLWSLAERYKEFGARLYAREGFTRQTARSLLLQPQLSSTTTDACRTLQIERDRLLKAIHYPVWYSELQRRDVRVGVLEFASTIKSGHQAFWMEPTAPAWHLAKDLELEADKLPTSPIPSGVDDASVYSRDAHHGTHVAAIIGGRQSACWSGLLPRARLVLVDLTEPTTVSRTIQDGVDAGARVFNVSGAFEGVSAQPLHDEIFNVRHRAVFVVAAGNLADGVSQSNLDTLDPAAVGAPIRWGSWGNVIGVSGIDWQEQPRRDLFYYGKRYVDLLAPAYDIYSATEAPASYGPAIGTSQAAPLATAAAAILVDLGQMSPADAKARLIATADWEDQYEGLVWGGRLNFEAAVRFPQRSFLVTATDQALRQVHSIAPRNDPRIRITNAPRCYERHGSGPIAPNRIRFERILSLRAHGDGTFRVVYSDPQTEELTIILHASLSSPEKLHCDKFELFEEGNATSPFQDTDDCAEGLEINQIIEYVRGGTYNIQWED